MNHSAFSKYFALSLREMKSSLLESCLKSLSEILESEEQHFLLYRKFGNGKDMSLNIGKIRPEIERILAVTNNPEYMGGGIVFRDDDHEKIDFTREFIEEYVKSVEAVIERDFYQKNENCLPLLDFNCFKNRIVDEAPDDEHVFDLSSWARFFEKVYEQLYSGFDKRKEPGKVFYLKNVIDGISFGFFIDIKEFKRAAKYSPVDIPEMHFCIIDDRGALVASLNGFSHPFFVDMNQLCSYILTDYVKDRGDDCYEFLPMFKQRRTLDGRIELYQDEKLGERYKRYALFKLIVNAGVTGSYFDFVESAIRNIPELTSKTKKVKA